MGRTLIFLFSVVSYGGFLLVFLYLVAFLGNIQTTALAEAWPVLKTLVPYSVDHGREAMPFLPALLIDCGLIALFGLQHSIMARPTFKRAWTRIVPKKAERSIYVMIANVVLILLVWQWRPIPSPVLWHADSTVMTAVTWGVMGFGVVFLVWATFLIDHFELLGLKQGWAAFRNEPVQHPKFVTPYVYRLVRHPQYLGWLMIFWATPHMTAGHALLAAGITAYILIAIQFEERNLRYFIGPVYDEYRAQAAMLIPMPGKRYNA